MKDALLGSILAAIFAFVAACTITGPAEPKSKTSPSGDGTGVTVLPLPSTNTNANSSTNTNSTNTNVMPPSGTTNLVAGSGASSSVDGTGASASFWLPWGIVFDTSGNLYVADHNGNKIRKVTPAGVVTTLAGSGVASNQDGTGSAATFNSPSGIAIDGGGNLFVVDNNKIRRVTPAGVVTTFAGSGLVTNQDGTGTNASFDGIEGLCFDSSCNLYATEFFRIRKITSGGVVTTFAGSGRNTNQDGTGTNASFRAPRGIVIDQSGNLFVTDSFAHVIRKITTSAVVTTLAGSLTGGSIDGTGTAASFGNPSGIGINTNTGILYVSDYLTGKMRKVTSAGVVTTLPTVFDQCHGVAFRDGYIFASTYSANKIIRIAP